jgi:hypothetical protein
MAIWNILQQLNLFYGLLVYFLVIWNISPVLVRCAKKNLATLIAENLWARKSLLFMSKKCWKSVDSRAE